MKMKILLCVAIVVMVSCKKSSDSNQCPPIKEDTVLMGTYKLATYFTDSKAKYLVVFESGMGDDHRVWQDKKVAECVSAKADILMYDRSGYGKSTIGNSNNAKDINQVRADLEAVINKYANGRKIILVGHSIAGFFLRNYASQNASKLAGLVFIDPSHEKYQDSTRQDLEEILYGVFTSNFGANSGAAKEARQFMEYIKAAGSFPKLPNLPVTVFTSMKVDESSTNSNQSWGRTMQNWYDAHESLKSGVTDFKHFSTLKAGHYIMKEDADLVKTNILSMLAKLP